MLTLYNRQNQLPPAGPPQEPPPKPPRARYDAHIAQRPADLQRRYTLSRTELGDFALSWAEPWWTGLFSVVDIATYLPGSRFSFPQDYHEEMYTGGGASAFSTTPWQWAGTGYGRSYDIWTGQKAATPFSEDPLLPYHGKGPVSDVLVGEHVSHHESEEVQRWKSQRRRLPFWRQPFALPPPVGADLSGQGGNVTFVVMK